MFDGQGSEMRIVGEIAGGAKWLNELSQDRRVPLGWVNHEGTRLGQPSVDDVERLPWFQRIREDVSARRNAQKAKQYRPGEPYGFRARQHTHEP